METICEQDLYIRHIFFVAPVFLNDLNVLDIATRFSEVCARLWPLACLFSIDGRPRSMSYNLVQGIYPQYPFVLSPYPIPVTFVEQALNRLPEAVVRNTERFCAVMTARILVAVRPVQAFHMANIATTARAVAIVHTMITVLRRH